MVITIDGMSFAARCRQAREAANLTQKELAEACGISDGTVSAWENGVAKGIIAENLFAAADKMGVSPRWLLLGDGEGVAAGAAPSELLRSLEDLPGEQRQAVLALIRSLKR